MDNLYFGFYGILRQYFIKDFIKDMFFPLTLGVGSAYLQSKYEVTIYDNLIKLINYAVVYLPVMVTIILTAYTVMIGALKNAFDIDALKKSLGITTQPDAKDSAKDRILELKLVSAVELKQSISASFAANIIVSTIFLLICFTFYIISLLGIHSVYYVYCNLISFGMVITMITYPIIAMVGVVIDMFNISQL